MAAGCADRRALPGEGRRSAAGRASIRRPARSVGRPPGSAAPALSVRPVPPVPPGWCAPDRVLLSIRRSGGCARRYPREPPARQAVRPCRLVRSVSLGAARPHRRRSPHSGQQLADPATRCAVPAALGGRQSLRRWAGLGRRTAGGGPLRTCATTSGGSTAVCSSRSAPSMSRQLARPTATHRSRASRRCRVRSTGSPYPCPASRSAPCWGR